jgi:hypothetical protein
MLKERLSDSWNPKVSADFPGEVISNLGVAGNCQEHVLVWVVPP